MSLALHHRRTRVDGRRSGLRRHHLSAPIYGNISLMCFFWTVDVQHQLVGHVVCQRVMSSLIFVAYLWYGPASVVISVGLTDSLGRWSYVRFVSCCVLCVLFVCGAMQTTFFPSVAHSKHTYGHHHSRKEHLQHGIKSAKTQHGCGPRHERRNIATICFFFNTSATLLVIVRETQFMSSSTKASNERGSTSHATDRS